MLKHIDLPLLSSCEPSDRQSVGQQDASVSVNAETPIEQVFTAEMDLIYQSMKDGGSLEEELIDA